MRPLELEVEGFRSYDRPVTFDWRGRHLVGIVGPIGSGKSSILDAIAFALYGKTPVFERESKTLIHQQSKALRVRLDFAVGDTAWRVLRVVRRKSGSQHALYRLADAGATVRDATRAAAPEVEKERAVTARIESLLGLDFAAFNRSVLLAQNRFARFLHAAPAERDRVLKGVFGFDRIDAMHQHAKTKRAALDTEVAGIEGELAGLGADREALDSARRAQTDAATSLALLKRAAEAIADATVAEDEASRIIQRVAETLATVDEVALRLPSGEEVAKRQSAVADASIDAEKAIAARTLADQAAEDAVTTLDAMVARIGNRAGLARSREILASLERARSRVLDDKKALREAKRARADADRRLRDAEGEATRADADEIVGAKAVEAAVATRREAEAALRAAEQRAMAASLAKTLSEGASCPVCGQTVDHCPTGSDPTVGDAAASSLAQARHAEDAARGAAAEAVGMAAAAREAVAGARRDRDGTDRILEKTQKRLRKTEAEVTDLAAELTNRLGLGDPIERLASIEAQLDQAEATVDSTRAAARSAARRVEASRLAETEAKAGASRLANRLANLAGSLGTDLRDGPRDGHSDGHRDGDGHSDELDNAVSHGNDRGQDLVALAKQVRQAHDAAQARAVAERRDAEAERTRAQDERHTRMADLGLDADTDVESTLVDARRTHDRCQDEVARLETALERAEVLGTHLGTTRSALRRYRQLADDLTAPRFLRFLLDEERALLAELGSARFEMLSGGRYRFTDDGTFDILDLANAEATRKVETLSGGETFLASLALALALAETVTGGGGRLDAFFLDEGFGALDDEHLDLAMDGIERLVADNPRRLVTIVSHVPALRQRVDDLIVLDKDPVTGASRVARGAASAARPTD